VLSGLEGPLVIVGLEVMAEDVRAGIHIWRVRGREFHIVEAATLKLRASNKVWTNKTEADCTTVPVQVKNKD